MTRRSGASVVGRGWWISFVVLLVASVTFSVVVGDKVAGLDDPVELGHSTVGEWADLSEFGFRVRLDEASIAESFPSAYDEGLKEAPDGMALLRVRLTIEPVVDQDEGSGCVMELFNDDGERLTRTEYGIAGPEASDCSVSSTHEAYGTSEAFQSQLVWVVLPGPVETYTLEVNPLSDGRSVEYWRFTM